jgi:hypothetical protein
MCDIQAGQLILCFPKTDPAGKAVVAQIREHQIEHIEYIESMDTNLDKVGLTARPSIDFDLHLVGVPSGQEEWKVTYLQFFYTAALMMNLPTILGNPALI